MPPRLSHKKSRKGCIRCKSRRVKCSEERPSCAACLRHSLPCEYPQDKNRLSVPSDSDGLLGKPASKSSSVLGPVSPYSLVDEIDALDSDYFQRRLLELRLLHHYVTVVSRTMPASKGNALMIKSHDIRELYIVDAVQLGFEYPFLLNTIFAISSLHKTQSQPQMMPAPVRERKDTEEADTLDTPAEPPTPTAAEVADYARAHRIYLNMAIRQQREALIELGPKNADAVGLTSVLLSVMALKILPEEPNLKYEPPVQWLSMAHAISAVIGASQPFLPADGAMQRMMTHNEPDFGNRQVIYNADLIAPFQAILDYPNNASSIEEENQTYTLAVTYMAAIYRAIQNHDPHRQIARRIMSTGPILPKQFVELVNQRRPKALVILAYIMVMTKYVEEYWFFRGMAEHEVYGVQSILPNEWQWTMGWPLGMLQTLADPRYRNLDV